MDKGLQRPSMIDPVASRSDIHYKFGDIANAKVNIGPVRDQICPPRELPS